MKKNKKKNTSSSSDDDATEEEAKKEFQERIKAIEQQGKDKGLSDDEINKEVEEYLLETSKSDGRLVHSFPSMLLSTKSEEERREMWDIFLKSTQSWKGRGKGIRAEARRLGKKLREKEKKEKVKEGHPKQQ